MGRITSGIGLASGINSKDIIDQLMTLEGAQKKILQSRVDTANNQKKAYAALLDQLNLLQGIGTTLEKPSTFTAATATSSNKDVLTATTTAGAAVGNYSFRVARLVTAQQNVSNAFSDFDTQAVGAGTITVEMGGGELSTQTTLAELNGGAGVRRGQFRIYDRSGKSAVIDTTDAVSVDDVVKKINTSIDIGVRATVSGNKLVLTDATGSTANNFVVQDLGDGHSAADLGIATATGGVAASTVTGTAVHYLSAATTLSKLNDGLGVRTAAEGGDDFRVTLADGTTANINLSGARTTGDVLQNLNTAAAGKLTASVNATGDGLKLTDLTAGGSAFSVTALNNSKAAADLGIHQAGAGNAINGGKLMAGINTVLLSRLNGGAGLSLGQVRITDRAGHAQTIDLSAAKSVQDVLDTINNTTAGGFAVEASLKDSGNGIQIRDKSGGTGTLIIADTADGSTSATKLGLVGTFDLTKPAALGANLQRQWLNEKTALKSMNGGRGVTPGVLKVTNSAGVASTLDFSNQTFTTLGELMAAMNTKLTGTSVTVGLNATGDGILMTDAAAGANKLTISDLAGTTAKDLQIAGTAAGTGAANVLNGSYEKTVTVSAADTLKTLQAKLQTLGFGASTAVINDGTSYRMSFNALNSGKLGRVSVDGGATSLGPRTLVQADDAAVFVGGEGVNPLLITGSSNQLSGVVPGVNIELHGVSKEPVQLAVTRNADDVVEELQSFADKFNELVDGVAELTKWDPETMKGGLLRGEAAARDIQTEIYVSFSAVIKGAGKFRMISDIGLSIGEKAKVTFDEEKFRAAFADDPESVKALFTQITTTPVLKADGTPDTNLDGTPKTANNNTGLGGAIERSIKRLTDPVDGVIQQTKLTIEAKVRQFQDKMSSMDKLLAAKRARLERQFANMESVLSGLQGQQQALTSLSNAAPASAA